jgi:hypothetical protein
MANCASRISRSSLRGKELSVICSGIDSPPGKEGFSSDLLSPSISRKDVMQLTFGGTAAGSCRFALQRAGEKFRLILRKRFLVAGVKIIDELQTVF